MIETNKLRVKVFSLLGLFGMAAPCLAAVVSLQEAYRSAASKNEIVQQGLEKLHQIDTREQQLRGGIFPNLSFNVGHTIQPQPADPVAREFSPEHQTTINLSLSQPLFRGVREWNGLKQLGHLRSAQLASQEQLLNRLYQEVAAAYLQVLSLQQDLHNLTGQKGLYEERIKELGARARRGESNRTDVVTAESTQSTLTAESHVLEGQLEAARETLHFLTALPKDSQLVDPKLMDAPSISTVDTYLNRVGERPDMKAATSRLEAAQKAVTVAWGTHWPTVDLTGNYYLTRPGFLKDIRWDVGLRLSVPIFEGFATQAKVTEAVSLRKEADLELERTRRAARQEISTLHRRVSARLAQLTSLRRSAELSRRNASLLQRDYRRGLARNIDVQLALTEARVSQRSLDQAHFQSQLELIQLQAASGLALALPPGDPQ